ncbi:MAG: hypothetical protein AB1345_14070 [Chloroflexota bacterium]
MKTDSVYFVLCLTAAIVVCVNGFILLAFRRKSIQQIDILHKASQHARQPWKSEDEALRELAGRVSALKADLDEKSE